MTADARSEDVVTVIRLLSLKEDPNSGIVATMGQVSMRRDGDSIYLVGRNAPALRRLKVGDVVQGMAERFGVMWLTEQSVCDVRRED
jgi:hypothetical protein